MSSRAVKQRLRANDNEDLKALEESLKKQTGSDSEEEAEEEDETTPGGQGSINAFSLLGDGDEGGVDVDDEASDDDKKGKKKTRQKQQPQKKKETPPPKNAPRNNRGRRRKGRGKKKGKDEDIDEIMRELNINGSAAENDGEKESEQDRLPSGQQQALLSLSPDLLSADAELKRLFGAKTVASHRQEKSSASGMRGQNVRKKMVMVAHKPSWPPVEGGISMDLTETKKGVSYFNTIWSEQYKKLQEQFFMCVETMDPDRIAELLQFHPYHLDSLLQLSEVCTQSSEHETAIDLVERAILRFEHCWHPLFYQAILKGAGRLEYKNEQNRPFHLALFRYIHMLGRRGCVRTALEYCKLMLCMDPLDPLAILLSLDHFCIRAQEYDYLMYFVHNFNAWHVQATERPKEGEPIPPIPPLLALPNFAYSAALARYFIEARNDKATGADRSSSEYLQDALVAFPMILVPLVEKCGFRMSIKETGCPLTWEEICKHKYFCTTYDSNMKHIVPLFVHTNFALWKSAEVSVWLKIAAWEVIKRVDRNDSVIFEMANARHDGYFSKPNVYNHVLLSDVTDAISHLPGQARIFRLYEQTAPRTTTPAYTSNPLALFLSTLMPWTQVPDAPPEGAAVPNDPQQGTEWLLANLLPFLGRAGNEGGRVQEEDNCAGSDQED